MLHPQRGRRKGTHRNLLQLRHLAQDLDVPQLVKVEVPFPLHQIHLELGLRELHPQGRRQRASPALRVRPDPVGT